MTALSLASLAVCGLAAAVVLIAAKALEAGHHRTAFGLVVAFLVAVGAWAVP